MWRRWWWRGYSATAWRNIAADRRYVSIDAGVVYYLAVFAEDTVGATQSYYIEMVEKLPKEDQAVLHLRFGLGWTANRINDEMKLGGQRRAYAVIDRALNRLRGLLRRDAVSPPVVNKRR